MAKPINILHPTPKADKPELKARNNLVLPKLFRNFVVPNVTTISLSRQASVKARHIIGHFFMPIHKPYTAVVPIHFRLFRE